LLIELVYALSLPSKGGFYFVVWAWTASLAAALAGAFLGLLFGLPSLPVSRPSTRVEAPPVPDSNPNPASPSGEQEDSASAPGTLTVQTPTTRVEQDLPYNDSTSLEQIADWLTKIIVGLTLTQYSSWSQRFDTIARGLTNRLLGIQDSCVGGTGAQRVRVREVCEATGAVPGGSIIIAFAAIGFLVAYLWMRRYFIIEMVVGKRQAVDAFRQAQDVLAARAATQLQEERVRAAEAAQRASEAERNRLQAELQAAQARVSDVIESARAMGTAPMEQINTPAVTQGIEAQILANARQVVPQDDRALAALESVKSIKPEAVHPDDPWLGRFGGQSEEDGVMLTATISPLGNSKFF
jgi:hypothetical protein